MSSTQSKWIVEYSNAAAKLKKTLPSNIQEQLDLLAKEIELLGPIRINWRNFGALNKVKGIPENSYHCHIKKSRPTYVACWCVRDKKIKFVEIYYVGTHEKAPY